MGVTMHKASEKVALLVIDPQKVYTDPDSELYCRDSAQTLQKINRLIAKFSDDGAPIVYVRHIHAADGSDLGRMFDYAGPVDEFNFKEGSDEVEYDTQLQIASGAVHLVKNRYSAFRGTGLHKVLSDLGVSRVVVCGFMTNFCCESTAREAHDRDFYVTFLPDATGCPDLPDMEEDSIRQLVAELLEAGFATIQTTDEYLV